MMRWLLRTVGIYLNAYYASAGTEDRVGNGGAGGEAL
jgi:hypothetical protein